MGTGSRRPERVAVVGSGAWGTTLAIVAARAGNEVALYVRDPHQAAAMAAAGSNDRFLPGALFPPRLRVTSELGDACRDTALILLVVPSQTMRANARALAPFVGGAVIVSAAKGLERGTLKRMTEVAREELDAAGRGAGRSAPSPVQTWRWRSRRGSRRPMCWPVRTWRRPSSPETS